MKNDLRSGFSGSKKIEEVKFSIFKENLKPKYGEDRSKILFPVQLMLIFCQYGLMGSPKGCATFDFSKSMHNARGYYYLRWYTYKTSMVKT